MAELEVLVGELLAVDCQTEEYRQSNSFKGNCHGDGVKTYSTCRQCHRPW